LSHTEAGKWNTRFQSSGHNLSHPRAFLEEYIDQFPKRGWAIDVAMGTGHNANLLAERGLNVLGVDFSIVALEKAKQKYQALNVTLINLPEINLKEKSQDVILNFWFLDRKLFPLYQRWLKPGGLLMFETMRFDPESGQSHSRPEFLVQPGELMTEFSGWEFLVYDENISATVKGKPQLAVRMLVRKPTG
jgi:SAM-dependent methyltransferase